MPSSHPSVPQNSDDIRMSPTLADFIQDPNFIRNCRVNVLFRNPHGADEFSCDSRIPEISDLPKRKSVDLFGDEIVHLLLDMIEEEVFDKRRLDFRIQPFPGE